MGYISSVHECFSLGQDNICTQTIIIMKRKLKCIGFVAHTLKLNHESTEVLFYAFKDFVLMSFLFIFKYYP